MKNLRNSSLRPLAWAVALLTLPAAPFAAAQSSSADRQSAANPATPADTDATGAVTRSRTVAGNSSLTRGDRRFITKAAKLGLEEVRLSRLAATRASRPEVRQYAQMLAEAHEKANTELIQLASDKSVVLSMDDNPNLENWTDKKGDDFDEDYLEEMIDAHEDAVELLEERVEDAEDGEVAAYARKHLPAMQEHLRKARELHRLVD